MRSLAMDAFAVLAEHDPLRQAAAAARASAHARASAGASVSGDRDRDASDTAASASACVPAAVLYQGTLVNVSMAKNNKLQVTARIAGKNHQVLELEPADLVTGVCTANAVAVRLELSLRDGECRTAAMARKIAKDTLAELHDCGDSDSAARAASCRGSSNGDDPMEYQRQYLQSYDRVGAQCPNLVIGSDAFGEVPLAAHPTGPTMAKYSYTLGHPEHACKIIVNLKQRSYYVTSWGVPPPSAGLTVDGRGGVLITWGRHGGAKAAFELALQAARW
jgi:hypothetical protein